MRIEYKFSGRYIVSFPETNRINLLMTDKLTTEIAALGLQPGEELILDLAGIQFIDSAGFQCILSILSDAHRLKFRVEIQHAGPEVKELISLLNLEPLFIFS